VILAGITPNIGSWEDTAPDPLSRYLESLSRLVEGDPKLVLPGHRDPIERVAERAQELRAHHAERLDAARSALVDGARTAYEVAQRLWSTSSFTLHEQRFALAEALAHVERLETESRARQVEPGRFEPV
jgi:glyoxylase-like metal-dependent hydrolase (beta-lactamase superfamily II)